MSITATPRSILVPDKVAVNNHEVSFGDESFEIEMERRECLDKFLNKCDERSGAVSCPGVMLTVIGPHELRHRLFRAS